MSNANEPHHTRAVRNRVHSDGVLRVRKEHDPTWVDHVLNSAIYIMIMACFVSLLIVIYRLVTQG